MSGLDPFEDTRRRAKMYRRYDMIARNIGIVSIVVLVIIYGVTIAVKGANPTMLIGVVGFAMLTYYAVRNHSRVKTWDRKIDEFEEQVIEFDRRWSV